MSELEESDELLIELNELLSLVSLARLQERALALLQIENRGLEESNRGLEESLQAKEKEAARIRSQASDDES